MANKSEFELLLRLKDEMSNGFKKIEQQGDKTFSALNTKVTRSSQSISGLSTVVTGLGGAFVALGIGKVATSMLKLGASAERTKKEFGLLTKSQEKGNQLFNDLNELANKTPLENFDLYPIAQSLLAFGSELENITPELTMLGDLALGDSEKMGRLADAFGKVQTKGKASLEELNRFAEAGVPVFDALAENLGVTKEQVFDLVSKGKVGFVDLKDALVDLTSEGGQFHNIMAEVSETAEGKFSTAVGKSKLALADLGEKVLPVATAALDAFIISLETTIDIADRLGEMTGFKTANEELNKYITTVKTVNSQNEKIKSDIDDLNAIINKGGGIYGGMSLTAEQAGFAIDNLESSLDDNIKLAEEAKKKYQELGGTQKLTINGFEEEAVAVSKTTSNIEKLTKSQIKELDIRRKLAEEMKAAQERDVDQEFIKRDPRAKGTFGTMGEATGISQSSLEAAKSRNEELAQLNLEFGLNELERLQIQKDRELEIMRVAGESEVETEKYYNNLIEQENDRVAQKEKRIQQARRDDAFATASAILNASQMATKGNKKAGNALKVLALAEIQVNAARAVMNAWASGPIYENIAETIAIGAQQTAATAIVASQSFATGGIVGGNSYTGDKVPVNVNSKEMILNMDQQKTLFDQLNGGGSTGGGTTININASGSVGLDEQKLAQVVADAVNRNTRTGRTSTLGF